MPKKIDAEVRARAVRLVKDHQQEYSSVTEAMTVRLSCKIRLVRASCLRLPGRRPTARRGPWPHVMAPIRSGREVIAMGPLLAQSSA